jgi:hypothetical protein
MQETIIKKDLGKVIGISWEKAQPKKTFSLYDGDVLVAAMVLTEPHPHVVTHSEEYGKQVFPGVPLDLYFAKGITAKTDGEGIDIDFI